MRDLLSELYNKVINFFQLADKGEASKNIASNRLKLVLMQDRTNLDSSTIEKMRIELVDVISKYVEIDTEEFNVNLEGVGDSIALMLNIPVIRAKTPEEIEAATKAAEEPIEAEEETEKQEEDQQEENEDIANESENAEADSVEENEEPSEDAVAPEQEKSEKLVTNEKRKESK